MKRRSFGALMGSCAAGAVLTGMPGREAKAATPDASQLGTTLNPMGGEMVGNAAGTIPAWTGGMTEIPAGISWDPATQNPVDFWPDEQPLYVVDQANMAQYSALLSDGVQFMIKNKGLSLKVYPTHRTAAVPGWVADNIKKNVGTAQLAAEGGRFGFVNGYGGYPFPILDQSDPLAAGAQCIWNHETRWPGGTYIEISSSSHISINGVISLSQVSHAVFKYPYYDPKGDVSTYNGYTFMVGGPGEFAPANIAGEQTIHYESSNTLVKPNITWQLLSGQGRVRKAPEVAYDTPSSYMNGLCNYDEYYAFGGAADKYDWKLLDKREMLIPYNNNNMLNIPHTEGLLTNFVNPDHLRWELHRVWVVDATLHPGERNVLARRRMYFDEDTWIAGIIDSWDGAGNIFRHNITTNAVLPNLPGTIYNNNYIYNLQNNTYGSIEGTWSDAPSNQVWAFHSVSDSSFNPQTMAASANY